MIKKQGTIDDIDIPSDYSLYLGHTRAPTGDSREFNPNDSHPFQCGYWIVGHNGIIRNFGSLQQKYAADFSFNVDSAIIPYLISLHDTGNVVYAMRSALELLDGIYGLWMYDLKRHKLYLARSASTVYYNEVSFSSRHVEGLQLLEEGYIYDFFERKTISQFSYSSPYFVV